jgi:hypothetical protein
LSTAWPRPSAGLNRFGDRALINRQLIRPPLLSQRFAPGLAERFALGIVAAYVRADAKTKSGSSTARPQRFLKILSLARSPYW